MSENEHAMSAIQYNTVLYYHPSLHLMYNKWLISSQLLSAAWTSWQMVWNAQRIKKHKEVVSMHKVPCHSAPGDLLNLKTDRTPLWHLRKSSCFTFGQWVTWWHPPTGQVKMTTLMKLILLLFLDSFKWGVLWKFIVHQITGFSSTVQE